MIAWRSGDFTLRTRILLTIAAPLVVLLTLVAVDGWTARRNEIDRVTAQQELLTALVASDGEGYLERGQIVAAALAARPTPHSDECTDGETDDIDETIAAMDANLVDQPLRVTAWLLVAPSGMVRCASEESLVGVDAGDQPWLAAASGSRLPATTYENSFLDGVETMVSTSVGSTGQVVVIGQDPRPLANFADSVTLPVESTITVVASDGSIVARQPNHDDWAGGVVPTARRSELIEVLRRNRTGNAVLQGLDNLERSYTYTAVPDFDDLTVAVGVPVGAIAQQATRNALRNVAVVSVVAVASIAIALLVLHRAVTGPLSRLLAHCRRVSIGRDEQPAAELGGAPEIASLAEAFDEMRANLARRESDLRASLDDVEARAVEQRLVWETLETARSEQRLLAAPALHDDTIQVITSLAYQMGTLARQTTPAMAAELLVLESEALSAVERLRLLLFELTPVELEQDGLAAAVQGVAQRLEILDGHLRIDLDVRLSNEPPPDAQALVFLGAREAISNAQKHASAQLVTVSIRERAGGWQLRVVDDGSGYDTDTAATARPGHLGLAHLRFEVESAGGWMELVSQLGAGSTLELWVPPQRPESERLRVSTAV